MTGMQYPPSGKPINKSFSRYDRIILKWLRDAHRCQQRLITDGGRHYIFCGGYYHAKAAKTQRGLRCKFHQ